MTAGNASNTALELSSLAIWERVLKKSAYQLAAKRLVVLIFCYFLEHKHSITFTIGIPKIATEIEK